MWTASSVAFATHAGRRLWVAPGGDDGNDCTEDGCNPLTGVYHNILAGAPCPDADLCTTDTCNGGVCSNDPIDCDDADPAVFEGCLQCAQPAEGCACDRGTAPVSCFLPKTEDSDGYVVLSKEKAEKLKVWDVVEQSDDRVVFRLELPAAGAALVKEFTFPREAEGVDGGGGMDPHFFADAAGLFRSYSPS